MLPHRTDFFLCNSLLGAGSADTCAFCHGKTKETLRYRREIRQAAVNFSDAQSVAVIRDLNAIATSQYQRNDRALRRPAYEPRAPSSSLAQAYA
jgi:hypothetical protein